MRPLLQPKSRRAPFAQKAITALQLVVDVLLPLVLAFAFLLVAAVPVLDASAPDEPFALPLLAGVALLAVVSVPPPGVIAPHELSGLLLLVVAAALLDVAVRHWVGHNRW